MTSVMPGTASLPLSRNSQGKNLQAKAPVLIRQTFSASASLERKLVSNSRNGSNMSRSLRQAGAKLLEDSYLAVIESGKEPKPDRIGKVVLYDKPTRLKPEDQAQFRSELFALLARERDAGPARRSAATARRCAIVEHSAGCSHQGFPGLPDLAKYLDEIWIFPRERFDFPGKPWVMFELEVVGRTRPTDGSSGNRPHPSQDQKV